ncbi:MAG TPA: hypothetical protein VLF21_01140 [Candidatus Saccharimonadales bacterium]|nr:hypothetical protein [Candidatus Saccharimonadales bacterium]
MTAYVFYTAGGPEERDIARFKSELEKAKVDVKLLDADSNEGIRLAELYDVLARPAVVLARQDGQVAAKWDQLPLVADISYLANS